MVHIKVLSQSTYIVNISDEGCLVKTLKRLEKYSCEI